MTETFSRLARWRPPDKKIAAKGDKTEAAFDGNLRTHCTARLAHTKAVLVDAYNFGALTFAEAERVAARMRRRCPFSWRAA
jgi:hypothetical protein